MKMSSYHCKYNLFLLLILFQFSSVYSAYLRYVPQTIIQPDGTVIECFSSGDEFYNWLHDKDGYTIVINPKTHYYVYAMKAGEELLPTNFIVGRDEPKKIRLQKWLTIPSEKIIKIREEYYEKLKKSEAETNKMKKGTIPKKLSGGMMDNIVIFIRFADEVEFSDKVGFMDSLFNLENYTSLYKYYKEVSYGSLNIISHYFPEPLSGKIKSYKDQHSRSYYMPYDDYYNPDGYKPGENYYREWELIDNAFKEVAPSIPSNLGTGNICFVISGKPGAWNTLLWPHMSYHNFGTEINGKKVGRYNLQLRDGGIFHVEVLAHELFHTLGAPDLYHYQKNGISPAGRWDLMDAGSYIPAHMLMYMKFKYGEWTSSIPEITSNGTYSLNPVTSQNNNCYKIKSPVSDNEFFVLEYRNKNTSDFESILPGSGLLIYRINALYEGNANGPPDEVYVYRPNGTVDNNGYPNDAYFSADAGRTEINDFTNPSSFLTNGGMGYLNISEISNQGEKISFKVSFNFPFLPPNLKYPINNSIEVPLVPDIYFSWDKSAVGNSYQIQVATDNEFKNLIVDASNITDIMYKPISNKIKFDTKYYWRMRAINTNDTTDWSEVNTFTTEQEHQGILVWDGKYYSEGYSGSFIHEFLKKQDIISQYRKIFPQTLAGFEAVFLSFGVYEESNNPTDFTKPMIDVVTRYLKNGGRLYVEGGVSLTEVVYGYLNPECADLMGIKQNAGNFGMKFETSQILGIQGLITDNMFFEEKSYKNLFYYFIPEPAGAEAALVEKSEPEDTVAFYNTGSYQQKSFFYAYQLVNLSDGQFPSTRYELLYQILKFFGIIINDNYIGMDFKADTVTGNSPHKVQFTNKSKIRSDVQPEKYEWDFEDDGIIDSEVENPIWTYQKPGTYVPVIKIKYNNNDYIYKSKDTIFVFDGESAAEFSITSSCQLKIPILSKINPVKPFTIEGWIKPYSPGEFNNGSFAYLTASIGINMTIDKKIKITVRSDDRREEYFETKNPCIEYDKWQHIAFSFNGSDSARICVDSLEQEVRLLSGSEFKGEVFNELNPDANYLSIGNYPDIEISSYSFDGKIDEVRFWDGIRSLADIQKYMNDTSLFNTKGLLGFWRLNEGKGEIIHDKSINRLDGITDAAWRQGWIPLEPTSVEDNKLINNEEFFVYPNPASSSVKIAFNKDDFDNINLSLYDLYGNEIEIMNRNYHLKDKNEIILNLENLNSGIYFIRMVVGIKASSIPIVLIK